MAFYGKYRGKVVKNNDPLKRGRIVPSVPGILEGELIWAEPCVPFAGPKLGWYAIPPVDANVWVEFEQGELDKPIWSGCFWGEAENNRLPSDATGPAIKMFQADKMSLIFDEQQTRLTIKVATDAGTMLIEIDKNGIVLTADKVTLTVAPDKIQLKKTSATLTIDSDIALKKDAAAITVSESVKLENGASSIGLSQASVSINNGALEVM